MPAKELIAVKAVPIARQHTGTSPINTPNQKRRTIHFQLNVRIVNRFFQQMCFLLTG